MGVDGCWGGLWGIWGWVGVYLQTRVFWIGWEWGIGGYVDHPRGSVVFGGSCIVGGMQ